ncbi:hypothetical protein BD414DRAFT_383110, partial [Trametes punicea]
GSYVLLNAASGTALDVDTSGIVAAHLYHGEENQQWVFVNTGRGWAIRSSRLSQEGKALYLSFKHRLRKDAPVVASTTPVSWYVWEVDGAELRIHWPDSDLVFDLPCPDWDSPGVPVRVLEFI